MTFPSSDPVIDTELDRPDDREEPEWCGKCNGLGGVPVFRLFPPGWYPSECPDCEGKGVKDE
jgi:DnaJ-class molecular chaperone